MGAPYAYRYGEVAAMFCSHPSFNFDGGPEVRRQLRKLRDSGVGKMLFVSFRLGDRGKPLQPERRQIVITARARPAPAGHAFRHAWHLRSRDIRTIANQLPFRCPRCWSDEHPRSLSLYDAGTVRGMIGNGSPILCTRCDRMSTVRALNEVAALQNLTRGLIKKVTGHGRHI